MECFGILDLYDLLREWLDLFGSWIVLISGLWSSGRLDFLTFGFSKFWIVEFLDTWISGLLVFLMFVISLLLDFRSSGFMNLLMYGIMFAFILVDLFWDFQRSRFPDVWNLFCVFMISVLRDF